MDDIFEQLESFETKKNLVPSDWDRLEKLLLPKKEKRVVLWVTFGSLGILGLTTLAFMFFLSVAHLQPMMVAKQMERHEITKKERKVLQNFIRVPQIQVTNSKPSFLSKKETKNIGKSILSAPARSESTEIKPARMFQTSGSFTEVGVNNSENHAFTSNDLMHLPTTSLQNILLTYSKNKKQLPFSDLSFISVDKFEKELDLFAGISASAMRPLNLNSTKSLAYGTGVFMNLNYRYSKRWGIGLGLGLQKEWGHNLTYTYVSETRVFLAKSKKISTVQLQNVSIAQISASTNWYWSPKFYTSLGGYFNVPLQSRSSLSEKGTGSFSEFQTNAKQLKGYTDLLNNSEWGLRVTQSYRPNAFWAVTVGFELGLNSRLNSVYFPTTNPLKRKEISFSISRKIL